MHIKKYRDLEADIPLIQRVGVGGDFRFLKYNCMGQLNYDSGWQPNRIMNIGLDDIGGLSLYAYPMYFSAYVGTSSAANVDSMVQLTSMIGSSVNYNSGSAWLAGAPNYQKYHQQGYRFGPGNGTGLLQEVGVHPNDPDNMFARHLISPAINKASDETLDVYYRYAMFPDLTDAVGTVVIDGFTYDYIARPCNVDQDNGFSKNSGIGNPASFRAVYTPQGYVYDGLLTTITEANPAGASQSGFGDPPGGGSNGVYTAGTNYRDHTYYYNLDGGNIGSGLGIRSIVLGTNWYDTQIQFIRQGGGSERIPKDNTKVLTVNYRTSWGRRS